MGGAADLDRKDIRALIDQVLASERERFAAAVIRSVSAKQRPRRPSVSVGQ